MKRYIKKIVAVFMMIVILLSSGSLQGLSELFSSKASASAAYDLDFCEDDYISSIILNTNTESCALSADGKSVASMTLDYYIQPQHISLSKCFTEPLKKDSSFMSSVAAWEVLTFSPTDIYSESMRKQGYYQTILFDILGIAVDYNIVPAIVKYMNNHIRSALKAIDDLEIKVDDVVVSGNTDWSLLNAKQQHDIIQTTAGRMTKLEMRNQTLSDFNMIVKACTTVTDFVEKAAEITALKTLTEDVKEVINEMYSNSSVINNPELKLALLEIKNAIKSNLNNIGTVGLEMLIGAGKMAMDTFLSAMWKECLTSLLGSLGAGVLIGQVVGRGISNILFSTDKVIEKFYTMMAIEDFESLMCQTVRTLGQKYIISPNASNASNFLRSIDLLYKTYSVDFEYSKDFAETINTKGLINKINIFLSGTPKNLLDIYSIINVMNSSMSLSLGMLTNIDNYCWYLETDYPDVYNAYYGGMSDDEITNKFVEDVRKLTVACPTDVDVYDQNGNLCVSVKKNEVELCLPGYICTVENDVKHLLLSGVQSNSIAITGTADGNMTYTICEGDRSGFKRTMKFKDVPLAKGCTYTEELPEGIRLSSEEYILKSDDGTTLKPDYDTQPDVIDNITDVTIAEELFDGFPKEVIDSVADTMFNMRSVVDLSSYDISPDDAVALFSAIAKYYPSEYSLITGGDFTYKIIVSPNLNRIMKIRFYYGDDANLDAYQKRVNDLNAEIDALVAKTEGMSDFEKALYIHDYIVLNSEYDLELLDYMEKNDSILPGELRSEKYTEYSILVNGTGVCGSYALAYRAVLNAAGMECLYLSSKEMNHAWNMVKIDGEWYHVDCCWDDPVPDTYGRAKRTYFLRTDEEIMNLNHRSWTPGKYKAVSNSFSDMPRNNDYVQKYDGGKWYYLSGGKLFCSDVYGKNETEVAELSATAIDVHGENIYYSAGYCISRLDAGSGTSKYAYVLPGKKLGENPSNASIRNFYVDGDDVTMYVRGTFDGKTSTTKYTDKLKENDYSQITGIEISDESISLDVFDTKKLSASIVSAVSVDGLEIVWSSSDDGIASVDKQGNVTAKNIGEATITAEVLGFKASCNVTITGDGLNGSCGENAKWSFDPKSGTLTISGTGKMDDYEKAPSVPWNKYCELITNAIILEGISTIGNMTFDNCSKLVRVTIPNSVKCLGNWAFYNCESLITIEIPDSITSIGYSAFEHCISLSDIIIPNSVTSIGDWTFRRCTGLTSVTIPNGITKIGRCLFFGCTSLTSISIPNSVTKILYNAFGSCTALTSINIPDSVTSIEDNAFSDCISLASLIIPKRVTDIGKGAFASCIGLQEISVDQRNTIYHSQSNCLIETKEKEVVSGCKNSVIPSDDSVTSISDYAFYGCVGLTSITIPNNVTSIGDYAFSGCTRLTSIIIPDGITKIGNCLFLDCTGLTRITIPNSVTSIGNNAFRNCADLTSITIPDSITSIGYDAFRDCISLASMTIPSDVTNISSGIFNGCTALTSITIPDGVTNIGSYAFWNCISLRNVTIPENVTSIGEAAFYGCESLATITIPTGITTIKQDTFSGCRGLTNIQIPDSVTCIETFAFSGCSGLTSITIPNNVKTISCLSFADCTGLTSIRIPKNVTKIESNAFMGCSSIESIVVDPENAAYDSRNNCNAIIDTENNWLLFGCKNTVIPNSITTILDEAFRECTELRYLSIPNSVTKIGYMAFNGCTNLNSIIIPDSVLSIWGYSFDYCFELNKILIKNPNCDFIDCRYFNKTTVFYGHENSTAQSYAEKNDFKFVNIDAQPHEHDYFLMDYVEPTAEYDGYEYYECYCGESSYKNILHNFGEPIVSDPTCIEDGNKSATCTNCGATEIIETIPAIGKHDYKLVSTTPGDCLNAPVSHYTCTVCGDSYDKVGKIDDGHTYKDTVVKPTCTEKGYTKSVCEKCGETVISDFVSPLGHSMKITHSDAYCSAHDTLEYKCKRCGYTESVAADTSKLETKTVVVEPTCTKSGSESEVCVLCGATVSTKVLNPLSHKYSDEYTIDRPATCTTAGSKSQHCIRCDVKRDVTVIEATGHKHTSVINAVEATCTQTGYTGDTFCTDCNSVIKNGTVTEKTAHSYSTAVTAPACTTDGYTTHTCSVCGYSYTDSKTPALGHTDKNNDGKCDRCGEETGKPVDPPRPDPSANCTCACHKTGIANFFFKIGLFFQKIFKKNKVCKCGVSHY